LGLITQKQENPDLAYVYFEHSVKYNLSKPFQKSLSYEKLGNLNFDETKFEIAGAYYDSVLQMKQDKNTKRIRKIVRKRESLNDVIYYENIVKRNDSILYISDLSEQEQEDYFQKYVAFLKVKEEEERIKMENEKLNGTAGGFDDAGANQNNKSGVFYFYNPELTSIGKTQFKNKYGNRILSDFWLISNNSGPVSEIVNETSITNIDSLRYDVSYYIDQIPKSKAKLDSITQQRNDAFYNLGLIYKEQFKEYEMAAFDFEKFLQNDPSQNLILPTKYHLYKTYAYFNSELSNKYRDEIVNMYPDSRYAEIIKNPNNVLDYENDEDSPEYIYKNAYICFEEEEYQYALSNVNDALKKFKGLEIEAKFELLKAFLLFNTEGEQEFIEKLNFVIVNYPNTEESDHAEIMLEKLKTRSK
jgi:tetratricopeptide (TPR) repeat protein